MSSRCPVPVDALLGAQLCGRPLRTYRGDATLMCKEHWQRVPESLQLRVWRTWRQLKREMSKSSSPVEYKQAALAYNETMQRAIDAAADAGGL